jgi:hypothetical protein
MSQIYFPVSIVSSDPYRIPPVRKRSSDAVAQILTEKAFIGLQTCSRICQRVDFAKLN